MSNYAIAIMGGNGDLAHRLLIPGIAEFVGHDDATVRIVGVGSSEVPNYSQLVQESLEDAGHDEDVAAKLASAAIYVQGDATEPDTLRTILDEDPDVIYFALPPNVTLDVASALRETDISREVTLAVEKPYGTTAEEADALDQALAEVTDRVIRIDHFLSESAVLNLVGITRSVAPVREAWSSEWIESIEVLYDETLALEGRAEFYDSTGAAEDMHQSHLLQSLAAVLAAGGESAPILRAMSYVEGTAKRARYTAGEIDGEHVPAYVDEEGVDPDNNAETLAQFNVSVDTDQWRGTTFRLRSGKAMGTDRQAIIVRFRQPDSTPAQLVVPFGDAVTRTPEREPYGRVAHGVLTGDTSVGVEQGTPQRCWEIIRPVLDAFETGEVPMEDYPAGSQGPKGWA